MRIYNMDHPPPHCHVIGEQGDIKVALWDLTVMNPPPQELPGKLRRKLQGLQEELLAAWEEVLEIPPGGIPVWEDETDED